MNHSRIPVSELALAYELRGEGVRWKWIAIALGYDDQELYFAVRTIRRYGLHDARVRVPDSAIEAARQMRAHSKLSWRAIARHLGVSRRSIECAVWRRSHQ